MFLENEHLLDVGVATGIHPDVSFQYLFLWHLRNLHSIMCVCVKCTKQWKFA